MWVWVCVGACGLEVSCDEPGCEMFRRGGELARMERRRWEGMLKSLTGRHRLPGAAVGPCRTSVGRSLTSSSTGKELHWQSTSAVHARSMWMTYSVCPFAPAGPRTRLGGAPRCGGGSMIEPGPAQCHTHRGKELGGVGVGEGWGRGGWLSCRGGEKEEVGDP